MATVTGIRRDLAVQTGWTNPDVDSSTTATITAAASHTLGTTLTAAGHGLSVGEVVRIAGTAAGNDGRYDGYHVVLAVPSSSTFVIRVPFLTNQTSGTARERTSRGDTLTSSEAMTVGNGTVTTRITMDEAKAVVLDHQMSGYENDDGTPGLTFGGLGTPTMVIDDYQNGNWPNGGTFRDAAAGENPVFRFDRCSYVKVGRTRESAFGGNRQEIVTVGQDSTFRWLYPGAVPFLGTGGVFVNCIFQGATSIYTTTFPHDHSLFIALPRLFERVTIDRFGLGLKQEYGSAFFGSVRFSNCGVEAFTSRNQQTAGVTDGAINLVDSVFDRGLVACSNRGQLNVFRTIRAAYRTAAGAGVSGAYLYAMDGTTERKFALTFNVSVSSGHYQGESTTVEGVSGVRDIMYYFRPGERVQASGFSNAANNGAKTVRGVLFGGTRYADPRTLDVGGGLTTESSGSRTLTKLPPISTAAGVFADFLVHVFHAVATSTFGNNAYTAATTESVQEILDDLTDIQGGTSTRIRSTAFNRTAWKMVLIPPYPNRIETQDFTLPLNTGGEPVGWNPLAITDPDLFETTAATVAAYTELDSLDKLADYLAWWKRQPANHAFPRHDLVVARRNGSSLDFGAVNVRFNHAQTTLIRQTVAGRIDIKAGTSLAATTNLDSIRTTGTIDYAPGAQAVPVVLRDTSGQTGRLTVTCADTAATLAVYAPDGTLRGSSGTSSITVALTAAQSVAGMKVVAARTGYRAQVRTVSMAGGGARTEAFGALARLDLPDGASMIAGASLSDSIAIAYNVADVTSVRLNVDIGNALVRVQPIMLETETANVTADGLKYLAFGGGQFAIGLSPTAGDSLFMPSSSRLRRAASGDANAGVLGTVFHPLGTPIDSTNGQVQIAAGISTATLAQALLVNYDLRPMAAGTQSVAGDLNAIRAAVESSASGLPALRTLIQNLDDDVDNSTSGLVALHSILTNSAYGLAAIRALVAGIDPAGENAIRDAILNHDIGSTTVAKTLEALLALVGGAVNVDTENRRATFRSLEATPADRVRVTYGEDGDRTAGEVL